MKVTDLFCGAGGFSEGFRIADFNVVFGLDNWAPAIATHKLNHPEAGHHLGDILKIKPEEIDSVIPDTEVIIGSPPCISFSYSNKAGKADKSLGTALIEKFLQIVAVKKNKEGSILKYWLMENVPNSSKYIKESYTFEELRLPGGNNIALEIPTREILNAADYGTPQTRSRFVCGNYPIPKKTVSPNGYLTMKQILNALGNPLKSAKLKIEDICWAFEIAGSDLTDHYYDTKVQEFEWKAAKRLKVDHGFMGKMSFPENLERPSRTVMATQSAVSRESILFSTEELGVYRLPTIREIACFMSFPLTYQFEGKNEATKYRLVGNAVCPKMSAALALAIKLKEGLDKVMPSKPVFSTRKPALDLTGQKHKQKKQCSRNPNAKFRSHVPYLKVLSLRVDLDNLSSDFGKGKFVWKAVLHRGTGKKAIQSQPKPDDVKNALGSYRLAELQRNLKAAFNEKIPSANGFQKAFINNNGEDCLGPAKSLEIIKGAVDDTYPEDEYNNTFVDVDEKAFGVGRGTMPIRILAALYSCQWLVERIGKTG